LIPKKNPELFQVYGDKINHIVAFAVMIYLGSHTFSCKKIRLFLYLLFWGIAIEVIQFYLPHRDFSFLDIIADIIGLFLGLFIFRYIAIDVDLK